MKTHFHMLKLQFVYAQYTTRAMHTLRVSFAFPDSKVHGANMGPIWGRQDPGGPHVGPMNFGICVCTGFVSITDILQDCRTNTREIPLVS